MYGFLNNALAILTEQAEALTCLCVCHSLEGYRPGNCCAICAPFAEHQKEQYGRGEVVVPVVKKRKGRSDKGKRRVKK